MNGVGVCFETRFLCESISTYVTGFFEWLLARMFWHVILYMCVASEDFLAIETFMSTLAAVALVHFPLRLLCNTFATNVALPWHRPRMDFHMLILIAFLIKLLLT